MRSKYLIFLIASILFAAALSFGVKVFFNYLPIESVNPVSYIKQFQCHFVAILPKRSGLNWELLKKGIKSADAQFGTMTEIIEVESSEKQIEALKMSTVSKVEGIIIYPMNDIEITPVINKTVESGVHVVTVSADAPESKRTSFIGSNMKSSNLAGQQIFGAVQGQANVCILVSDRTSYTYKERIKGVEQAISKFPKMMISSVEETNKDVIWSAEKVKSILEKNSHINTLFCISSIDTIAAAQAVERLKRKDILIIGYDDFPETLEFIRKGMIFGTIVQKSEYLGYLAVRYLTDIDNGKWVPDTMDPDVILITGKNILEYEQGRVTNP